MKKSEVRNQNYTSIYNTEKASKRWFQPIFTQIWILHVLSTSKSILSFISRVSYEKTVIRHPLTVWKCFPKPLWGMGSTLVSTLFRPLKIKKRAFIIFVIYHEIFSSFFRNILLIPETKLPKTTFLR